MCGIAGLWRPGYSGEQLEKSVRQMTRQIRHRGPEGDGYCSSHGWALGHARLAIVDVAGGHQPIWNADRSVVIIGNNEIYNAPELRTELEGLGHVFKTHSDTEVALHAWEEWGEDSFSRLNGMFALAIVDTSLRKCILVRDPLGIKPLHYTRIGNGYAFASEIKTFFQLEGFETSPNRDAIHLFMNFRYIPDDRTLFKGVERLPPGSYAVLSEDGIRIQPYFSWQRRVHSQVPSYEEATHQLQSLLEKSVKRHLISDVEVASYLSGGIDSSVVATLAAKASPGLRTFCVGFGEPTDENQDAERVAKLANTRHENIYIGMDPLGRLSEIIWHVEEPKVNCVQGFLLAEVVSKRVKVALSGLGGDELFAGYVNNDILYPMSIFSSLFKYSGTGSLSSLQGLFSHFSRRKSSDLFFRAGELGLNLGNPLSFYSILRNAFDHNRYLMSSIYEKYPEEWVGFSAQALKPYYNKDNPDILNEFLMVEARTKMVNDFLLTEDRVSSAHSLETRVPFLDKELVQFAFSLPSSYKYRFKDKKKILKSAASQWLPDEILNKKKWGFSFNPYLLFQTQLKDYAEKVLTEEAVKSLGVFSWKWIQDVLHSPPSPKMRWHYFNLWAMVGFTLWHDRFFGNGKFKTSI